MAIIIRCSLKHAPLSFRSYVGERSTAIPQSEHSPPSRVQPPEMDDQFAELQLPESRVLIIITGT